MKLAVISPAKALNKAYLRQSLKRVQETLFQEKEVIIENCLFGVDINPESVACRLRLWSELLKNACYRAGTDELEALPNTPDHQAPIIEQVEKILAAPDSPDLPQLEAEIDRLVYGLYGLTEEEIALVEGAL